MLLIEAFLTPAKLAELNQIIALASYVDGRRSGGYAGSLLKNNLEMDKRDAAYSRANALMVEAMMSCPTLQSYALPQLTTPVLFSRYGPGMKYDDHVDAAIQNIPGGYLRTDLSFTVFLASPDSYEGGELVLKSRGGQEAVKGRAGDMVVYHTGIVHGVEPVRSGWRHVAVGWIQSLVRDHAERENLYDLLVARDGVFAANGLSKEFHLINSVYINLLRNSSQP